MTATIYLLYTIFFRKFVESILFVNVLGICFSKHKKLILIENISHCQPLSFVFYITDIYLKYVCIVLQNLKSYRKLQHSQNGSITIAWILNNIKFHAIIINLGSYNNCMDFNIVMVNITDSLINFALIFNFN